MCDGRRPGGAGEVIRLLEKPHQSDVTVLPIININIKMRVKALDETKILAANLKNHFVFEICLFEVGICVEPNFAV